MTAGRSVAVTHQEIESERQRKRKKERDRGRERLDRDRQCQTEGQIDRQIMTDKLILSKAVLKIKSYSLFPV